MPSETPKPLPTLLFANQPAWHVWLNEHHTTSSGVWLQVAKKGSGQSTVTYDEALDTALCFGWIDGQRKGLDETYYVQKFTPRRKGSLWSKRNVNKVQTLIESGEMQAAGMAEIEKAKANGQWERAYAGPAHMEVSPDFQAALDATPEAAAVFASLNRTQKYSFLWRIETARTAATRAKRISASMTDLAANKIP